MDNVFLMALAQRINNNQMTIEQVPLPYKEQVQALLDGDSNG